MPGVSVAVTLPRAWQPGTSISFVTDRAASRTAGVTSSLPTNKNCLPRRVLACFVSRNVFSCGVLRPSPIHVCKQAEQVDGIHASAPHTMVKTVEKTCAQNPCGSMYRNHGWELHNLTSTPTQVLMSDFMCFKVSRRKHPEQCLVLFVVPLPPGLSTLGSPTDMRSRGRNCHALCANEAGKRKHKRA